MPEESAPEEVVAFVPAAITTVFPIKGGVNDNGDGTVTLTFFLRNREILNVTIPTQAAVEIRGELPASATILTPEKPGIIVPR